MPVPQPTPEAPSPGPAPPSPGVAAGDWRSRLKDAAIDLFGLDLRSLAIMRMGMGLILIRDLIMRAGDVVAFHSDKGALPRAAILEHQYRTWAVSLHMGVGHANLQLLLFALAGVFAVMLTLGYRTRLATVLSWLMLCSVQSRASIILQSGDVVLRLMLFWSLFLPLGARFSLDNLLHPPKKLPARSITSVATGGFILQMGLIYLFTALLKSGRAWIDGSAVYYALNIDYFAKQPFCRTIVESRSVMDLIGPDAVAGLRSLGLIINAKTPWIAAFFTYATIVWEYAGPALLLFPFRRVAVRTFVVCSFIFLHLGFFVGLEIGLFPWICIAGWLGLMPGAFWDRVGLVVAARSDRRTWTQRWHVNAMAFFCVLMVVSWNLSTIRKQFPKSPAVPSQVSWIGHTLRLDQNWIMFAPFPLKDDGWYRIPGELSGGGEVDLWTGEAPVWVPVDDSDGHKPVLHPKDTALELDRTKPDDVAAMYKNQRWRKYMRNLWSKRNKKLRLYYGKHMCRTWNAEHSGSERLRSFRMVYMKENTPKPGEPFGPIQPVMIWKHNCYGKAADND